MIPDSLVKETIAGGAHERNMLATIMKIPTIAKGNST